MVRLASSRINAGAACSFAVSVSFQKVLFGTTPAISKGTANRRLAMINARTVATAPIISQSKTQKSSAICIDAAPIPLN